MLSWSLVEFPAQFNIFKRGRYVCLVYFHITASDIIWESRIELSTDRNVDLGITR